MESATTDFTNSTLQQLREEKTTTGLAVIATTTAAAAGEERGYIVLVLLLLVQLALSVFSNVVLLVLIGRSRHSMTILNVFLLSLSVINLILAFNQVVLLGLLFNLRGQTPPYQLCHLSFAIQVLGSNGITLIQLVIGYNRYRTTQNPIQWERNHNRAWITTAVVWILILMSAIMETFLHIGGIGEDTRSCFWPAVVEHIPLKLSLTICSFLFFVGSTCVTAYYHIKTISLLKQTNATLAREMEMTSDIQYYERAQTTPEKTATALVVIFAVQMFVLFVHHFYDFVRMLIITVRWGRTGNAEDPSPTPILLFVTTISLSTTVVPALLMVISKRFKTNVEGIFKFRRTLCCNHDVYLKNTTNGPRPKTSAVAVASTSSTGSGERPKPDLSIFMGVNPLSKYRRGSRPVGSSLINEEDTEVS